MNHFTKRTITVVQTSFSTYNFLLLKNKSLHIVKLHVSYTFYFIILLWNLTSLLWILNSFLNHLGNILYSATLLCSVTAWRTTTWMFITMKTSDLAWGSHVWTHLVHNGTSRSYMVYGLWQVCRPRAVVIFLMAPSSLCTSYSSIKQLKE